MGTYPECRELQPQDEDGLEGEIPREVIQHDSESEAFEEVEETKDDPVSQPLDVILSAGAFESLEGQVRGEGPADKI